MSEPKFKPGQEVSGKIDCYRLIVDAADCGYTHELEYENNGDWLEWQTDYRPGDPTVMRRKPEPPTPIVVAIDGILAANGLLPNELSNRSLKLANFHDWRITEQAELHKGAHATLTLTIYPEGCKVPDTVTVPRAVVKKLLGCYVDDPGTARYDLRAHLDKLAEAVRGGVE